MAVVSLVLALLALGTPPPQEGGVPAGTSMPLVRVKPADPEIRRLMADGYGRSATFRSLVDRIHQSAAMVVVQFGLCANGRFRSCVTNVDGDSRMRHIRIKVNTRTTDDRLIATPYLLHSARYRAYSLQGAHCVCQTDSAGKKSSEHSQ